MKKLFQPLLDYLRKNIKSQWRKERVKCCACGNEWNCVFPNIKGGEYKLQCPKCGKRDSKVVVK